MPSKDPKTGKPLGGASKTRRKRKQQEHERARKSPDTTGGFEDLPPPPIESGGTAELVTWAAKGLALTTHRVIQRPDIFDTERDRLRFLADCFAKIGLVRDKGAEQDRIKTVLGRQKKQENEGTRASDDGSPPPPISRPPR